MTKIIKFMSHTEFYVNLLFKNNIPLRQLLKDYYLANHQKMLLACIFVTRKHLDCCKSHKPTCTWLLCLPGTEKHPTPQLSSCCCGCCCWCCCWCAAVLLSVLLSTLPAAGDEEEEVVAVIVRLLPVSVIWNKPAQHWRPLLWPITAQCSGHPHPHWPISSLCKYDKFHNLWHDI